MRAFICNSLLFPFETIILIVFPQYLSNVNESTVITVQVLDRRKVEKRDQGFLGVVNFKVADVIDLELGGHGASRDILVTHWYAPS